MTKVTTIISTEDYVAKMVNGKYHSLKYVGNHTPLFTLQYEGKYLQVKGYNYDNYFELEEAERQKVQIVDILEQVQSIEKGFYND